MVRNYQRKTQRPSADRNLRVTFTRREQIDVEKVAEVLIRVALREAGTSTKAGQAGTRLRALLSSER
ncbi:MULTISPECIES: hypothetical protein [Brevibacterium]|uniref:Uncharacterized protein n=2 Tax=Brevibacterium TaxID=1696 RepID=A0A2H1JKN7_BREAU|nr:hypothetical protein [Brevibacterium aurantiacum]SMX88086.1 hypothetical protein BAURA86_01807 [Brevibacterium aurantiacum]